MEAHQRTVDEALQEQHSSRSGLCETQVQERSRVYGLNKLQEEKKASLLKRLAKQLSDPMIIVLLGAALISGITSAYAHESYADTFIILFVVMVNAILGLYQEGKAEAAIEALKDMNAPACKVMRNGEIRVTASEDLVPGDVVVLEAGDAVPADGRVLECASLKVEESALTGESLPVEKQTDTLQEDNPPLGDRRNMVYMGSSVVYGRGRVLITATGMHTEMGKIADAILVSREEATPLQQKLNRLSKILSFLVLAICVFMFLFELLNSSDLRPEALLDTFMLAVSLAVAAIPEGLAAVVTVQLAIGVTRMARRNAVIRQLTAVETLGCTQVICSDKTGTLTQNCMRVVEHAGDDEYLLALAMSLCNDTQVHADGTLQGEPTEMALSAYGETLLHVNEEIRKYPRIHEYPFDSQRKMMTTMHRESDGVVLQFTKGAMDVVLQRCTGIWRNKKIEPMREEDREALRQMNKQMADQALRVLCAACKWSDHMELDMETAESDLVFLGLCGMMDPVREEVKPAIAQCRKAGIRPVMITGDHIDTAAAIAKSLHIITDSSQAMSGSTLDTLSQEELIDRVEQTFVYARVKPEHKVRI
ncbi:MAG: cation-translocating P-type ATPase, partial [[Clostridium] innocuum]